MPKNVCAVLSQNAVNSKQKKWSMNDDAEMFLYRIYYCISIFKLENPNVLDIKLNNLHNRHICRNIVIGAALFMLLNI